MNEEGSSTYVHVDVPTVNADGTVSTKQTTGFDKGKSFSLNGSDVSQGSGFLSGVVGNLVHTTVDDTIALVPNLIGVATGNKDWANWNPNFVHPVDPAKSSDSARVGGAIGSIGGLLVGMLTGKTEEKLLVAAAEATTKSGAERVIPNATQERSGNLLHPTQDWYWWHLIMD